MRMETNINKVETLIDADETKSMIKLSAKRHLNREAAQTILKRNLYLKPYKSHQEISIQNKQRRLSFCLELKKFSMINNS